MSELAARLKWGNHLTWSEVAECLKAESTEAVRSSARRWREDGNTDISPVTIQELSYFEEDFSKQLVSEYINTNSEYLEPSYLEEWLDYQERMENQPSWRELIDHAREGARIQNLYRPDIRRVKRRIVTRKPINVAFISDFHLGSPHTDYESFVDTSNILLNNDDMYIVVAGPDQEMAFSWFYSAEPVLTQVIPPYLQVELYRQWLNGMMPKVISVTGDNHSDQRLRKHLGDIGLVWRDDVPYFPAWGIIELEVGPNEDSMCTYEIVVTHKYKGSSIYHDLQPALRVMRDIYPLADVYVTAHTHVPAYMAGVFYPEARPTKPMQHFIVTGTFKTEGDNYSLVNFGGSGVLGVPTIQFWPEEYRVQYYQSPEQALLINGG